MASNGLKPPMAMDFSDTNVAKNWKTWREEIELYIDLVLSSKTADIKKKTFLYVIGEKGREIYKTLPIDEGEADRTVPIIVEAFERFCVPKANETLERYYFFTRSQNQGENFETLLTTLRVLAKTCNFGVLEDSLIRDRIVCGISNPDTREKLLREDELDLAKCITICKAVEYTERAVKQIGEPQVNAIHKSRGAYSKDTHRRGQMSQHTRLRKCKFCGKEHEMRKDVCPAWGKTCSKCGELNHFANQCDSLGTRKPPVESSRPRTQFKKHKFHSRKSVKAIDNCADDDCNCYYESSDDNYAYVSAVHTLQNKQKTTFARMIVNGNQVVKFLVDSGATCNIIPLSTLSDAQRNSVDISKSSTLRMYNNTKVTTKGEVIVKMVNPKNDDKFKVLCSVIDDSEIKCVPILGSTAAESMRLIEIKRENICRISHSELDSSTPLSRDLILKEYKDVFEGQGSLPGTCHLQIDPSVKPVVQPPRRVPVSIKEPLKKELDRLEATGIISKETRPTEWVSSLVCVTKRSGALRICIDPKPLNKALLRNHYPMRTIDDILPDLGRMKVFSTFDARNGYWHVRLDQSSSKLTCFNTIYGKYIWNVLPMGIKPASEEYQRRQDDALNGLTGVFCIADDILVGGEGETIEAATLDHDKNVRAFLNRCREKNLKLNLDKMRLKLDSVPYIGHVLTKSGLKPDPEKIKAIREMPPPTDVSGVRRLLGMVNYLGKFINNLSDVCQPIRVLTLDTVEFVWDTPQQEAFENIKDKLTSNPVLQYYDPKKPIVIQCDASSKMGLGACLLQSHLPVFFASRALTDAETRYSIIELEMLAVLFSVKKFHQFIYGADVEIHTDHRPLEAIMEKPIHSAPKRLQRMLVQLQNYTIKILWKPGNTQLIADTLSRATVPGKPVLHPGEKELLDVNMFQHVPISNNKLAQIQQQSEIHFRELKDMIVNGWPDDREKVPESAKPYFTFKGELSVYDGIVLKSDRVVIPLPMRRDIMEQLHSTHIGIESCLRRSRECVFWPGITSELKDYLAKCDICASFGDKNQPEPLMPHELTTRPWQKVGVDLCTIDKHDYLISVDYYSNFAEIDYITDQTAETVIGKLKMQFSRHGIPDVCFTDNAAIFTCPAFSTFANKWEFVHKTSSAKFSQSNGKVENAVKTMKRLILKAKKAQQDPYLAILEFRNTPSQHLNTSPTERLFNRKTKTRLPTTASALKFRMHNPDRQEYTKRQENQQRMKHYHDRRAKPLSELQKGDTVRIQPEKFCKEWRPGKIVGPGDDTGRSYIVETDNGNIRRNRAHLKKTVTVCAPSETQEFSHIPNDNRDYKQPTVTHKQSEQATECDSQNNHNSPMKTRCGREIRKPKEFNG